MEEFFVNLMYCIGALALLVIGFILITILISGSLKMLALIIDFVLDLRDILKDEMEK